MAANLQSRGLASFGKRLIGQIRSRDSAIIPSHSIRSVHATAYEKNPDEHALPTVVPDHVIPSQSEEYWAPHPETGVFGPATDDNLASRGNGDLHASVNTDSVLEQKAFIRPLEVEDLEKPVES
ncbi:hypothetical protein BUALT_Bualt06G0143400 [Buddleja alternifolia]|uniref:Late embryogenesis abundant protein n=1 Tax=Buddleja alternifolia TaxID=168488 RepID=A0AAV6XGR6_9LAMI|nr:hypothetical protein BUALT_Bualt06G0143400 [Buddleja alternifolia]